MDPHCQKVCVHSYPDIHSYFPSLSLLISYYISPSHLTLEPQNYLPDPKPLLLAHAPWFFLYYSLCPNCPFHVPHPSLYKSAVLKKSAESLSFHLGNIYEAFPYLYFRENWLLLCILMHPIDAWTILIIPLYGICLIVCLALLDCELLWLRTLSDLST